MKKKLLTILVCAAVMLTTACDNSGISSTGNSNESSSTSSKESSSSTSEESSSSPEESSSKESESTSSSSESAPESSAPSDGDNKGGFVHGTITPNSYTSEFLGIKAEFTEGWVTATDDILAQNNGITDMSAESINNTLSSSAVLFELVAATEGTANLNIVIENLGLTNGGKTLTADEYVDLAFPNIEAQFKAVGLEDVSAEKSTVNFLGSDTSCINTKVSNEGQTVLQKMVPISNGTTYMGIITFSAASEDELNSILGMFKSI